MLYLVTILLFRLFVSSSLLKSFDFALLSLLYIHAHAHIRTQAIRSHKHTQKTCYYRTELIFCFAMSPSLHFSRLAELAQRVSPSKISRCCSPVTNCKSRTHRRRRTLVIEPWSSDLGHPSKISIILLSGHILPYSVPF